MNLNTINNSIKTQLRVINAFVLLEFKTMQGDTSLGYLWVLVRTAVMVSTFLCIRLFIHAKSPHGISTVIFLIAGFGIWHIFSNNVNNTLSAIKSYRGYLSFPQVTPLDIIIARLIVIVVTEVLCAAILILVFKALGFKIEFYNYNILLIIFSISCISFLGIGFGCLVNTFSIYFPFILKIIPIFLRILFFISGVFFSVSVLSKKIGTWLLYNPIFHIIEMSRYSLSCSYPIYYDIYYTTIFTGTLGVIGLILERFSRRKLIR